MNPQTKLDIKSVSTGSHVDDVSLCSQHAHSKHIQEAHTHTNTLAVSIFRTHTQTMLSPLALSLNTKGLAGTTKQWGIISCVFCKKLQNAPGLYWQTGAHLRFQTRGVWEGPVRRVHAGVFALFHGYEASM